MKAKALLAGLALISLAVAAQDTIRLTRTFKEGEKDSYKMHSTVTMAMGDADVNFVMEQLVKKVYDNGEADVQTTMDDFHVVVNGNEVPVPAPPVTTMHVDKHGMPIKVEGGDQTMSRMQFMRFSSLFFDRDLKVGETIPIDYTDPKDEKSHTTGTVQLQSVTSGEAKIVASLKVTSAASTTPMNVDMTSYVDVASSKPNRLEGIVTNMATETPGGTISAMKFTMERQKG